jgi:chlorophyll/bacteriochlorophyll a synthase
MARIALSAVAELFKPITWFPPMWAFICGAIASGVAFYERWPAVLLGIIVAGPLICATSQAVNDWFDREVDAINEPTRPIPSGRIPGRAGLYIAISWTIISVAVASALGGWGFVAALIGLILAWAYSAPPFRFKKNGWIGNAACAFSYEGLAWITGATVMVQGFLPHTNSFFLAVLYSTGAHGIMTLNDFKSIEGDRCSGIASLPVQLGAQKAAQTACLFMLVPQAFVVLLLFYWERPNHAAAVTMLVLAQMILMRKFLRNPKVLAAWYSGFGVTLYVVGMLVSAFALHGIANQQ